ncbi:MAG TPA: biotin-dependent carboxyltransferase family protein [Aromatoleum sp.]|uniref:5-oxoprolinase subunit C family protein n=1 Tax=Aromatoleum sp. TaxID=2307007 RepID=UPI002B4A58F8|nr:biotin-dependent carboxyltransferase family protein [Aromatoleum sp.]HJV25235.1 biotin-dependent carboxyltransferase family protein [Aromatoleum sp.]
MSGVVEIVDSGLAVSVQDRGRTGYRNIGVPVSGALDPVLMAAANALVGNPSEAAVLEVGLSGPSLKALSGTVRVGLSGEMGAQLVNTRGQVLKVAPGRTATLFPGDILRIGGVSHGVGYVALSGGVQVPEQLGSRSTYLRAAIGGVQGRAPKAGDRLQCEAVRGDPWLESRARAPWHHETGPIRVILGPQEDHFTPQAVANFLTRPYAVTRDMDRMGLRLDGEKLAHNEKGAEIVSDGVAPGTIQVPANGQPIVLMADCQTSGGYPKIATVIRADLPRLAHLRPGDELRFVAVSHAEAAEAVREQMRRLADWVSAIQTFRPPGVIDEAALYGANLICGVVRGDEWQLHGVELSHPFGVQHG